MKLYDKAGGYMTKKRRDMATQGADVIRMGKRLTLYIEDVNRLTKRTTSCRNDVNRIAKRITFPVVNVYRLTNRMTKVV